MDSSNLVRDSKIARDLITVLRRRKRPLPLATAARLTMRMEHVKVERLRHIFANLLRNDPRIEVDDEHLRLRVDPRETAPLRDIDVVIVDTETTGGGWARGHRLIELAAVRLRGGRIVERYATLINPHRSIPPSIARLTGIDNGMVRRAPRFTEVAGEFLKFLGDAVIVAHNAPFDRAFLNAEFQRAYQRSLLTPFVCTVQMGRRFLPGLPSYRLDVVTAHLNILVCNRHRAMGDAEATAELFTYLCERMDEHGIADLASARAFRPVLAART
jgi:DNA polymerase III epsilon subunit family exonuclease